MSHSLNIDQERAATASGSVAIMAGAGTGKTFTLAHRYMHHIVADGLSPLSIVAATFTDKAANELRSRIRKLLRESNLDDEIIAEVESAQISTIHALCQRICRDFSYRIGIAPDFGILDKTYAPAWQQEKFDEAIGLIPKASLDAIGYNWFVGQLPKMMSDPLLTREALAADPSNWEEICREMQDQAKRELIESDEWNDAADLLPTVSGTADDKLEIVRLNIVAQINAFANGGSYEEFRASFTGFRTNLGSGKNWDEDHLVTARAVIARLRSKRESVEVALGLELNEHDQTVIEILPHLRIAFETVSNYLDSAKRAENVLDFNDLERYAVELLANDDIAAHYHERWRAILVDEFQDTNPVQAKIIERLTPSSRLTIVGDEKQAIYGFRRADVTVFERFRSTITAASDGEVVELDKTFRTHHDLVECTNRLFDGVLGDRFKPLASERLHSKTTAPHLTFFEVGESEEKNTHGQAVVEARHIADEIERIHRETGIPYSEFAILTRTWKPLNVIQDVLSANGIPSVKVGGGSLLDTREAQDCYSMLAFLSEPHDDIPLIAILRSPYFAVSDKLLFELSAMKADGRSWWTIIQDSPEFAEKVSVLNELLASPHVSASATLDLAERMTGYRAIVGNLPFPDRRIADLDGVHDLCRDLAKRGRGDVFSVARYIREALRSDIDIPRPTIDASEAVNLLTIHRSKGLEWDVVFVPALGGKKRSDTEQIMIDAEIGVSLQTKSDDHDKETPAIFTLIRENKKKRERDEERRLLYVAVTRARESAILSVGSKGDKNAAIELLRPFFDDAGIETETIEFSPDLAALPTPRPAEPIEMPDSVNIDPIPNVPTDLPVTALAVYSRCPRQFEFQIMNGHPGDVSEGGNAMEIGSIAHHAIETGRFEPHELTIDFIDASMEAIDEAAELAVRFRDESVYESLRNGTVQYEVPFRETFEGITFNGIADIVTDDMVVDHKTDSVMEPSDHLIQLWLYARAFGKRRAAIAYLRHSVLYEYSAEEMAAADELVRVSISKLKEGQMDADPAEEKCGRCRYNYICDRRFSSI